MANKKEKKEALQSGWMVYRNPDSEANRLDIFKYRLKPKSDVELSEIAQEMIEWAKNPEVLRFNDFAAMRCMDPQILHQWAERSEDLKSAIRIAKNMIASRRERGTLLNKYNSHIYSLHAPLYDEELAQWRRESKQLKEEAKAGGTITVVMEAIPDSSLVPKIEKKDDNVG